MSIDAIGGGSPAGAAPGGANANRAAGFKDEFLRLLVAQLQNQNPLQPQDGAEFVAQLADFASVEQGAEMNKRLEAIEAEQATASGAALAAFVGQNASASINGGVLRLDPEKGPMPELIADLPESADKMTAKIYDESGAVVRTINLGKQMPGKVSIGWDGTNNAGTIVPAGNYRVEIEAEATDGQSIGTSLRARAAVDAIEFTNGLHMLRLGALAIPPSDIESIGA